MLKYRFLKLIIIGDLLSKIYDDNRYFYDFEPNQMNYDEKIRFLNLIIRNKNFIFPIINSKFNIFCIKKTRKQFFQLLCF